MRVRDHRAIHRFPRIDMEAARCAPQAGRGFLQQRQETPRWVSATMDASMDQVVLSDHALSEALERYWGYTSFRPLQREAMDAILSNRDSIVVLPTGGGKSLCFQAPAVVRDGLAVVVSPLISLMKDQVDTLVGNGVPAACYNSSLASDRKSGVLSGLREGRFRLLYVSPERLVGEGGESFLSLLSGCAVSFVAIDEAHCISQWGHDFRPEYRQLGRLRTLLPGHQPACIYRDRNRAGPPRHRDAARPRGAGRAGGFVRSSQPRLSRAGARELENSSCSISSRGIVARQGSSTALRGARSTRLPRGCARTACARCLTMPVLPTTSAAGTRMPSSKKRRT